MNIHEFNNRPAAIARAKRLYRKDRKSLQHSDFCRKWQNSGECESRSPTTRHLLWGDSYVR